MGEGRKEKGEGAGRGESLEHRTPNFEHPTSNNLNRRERREGRDGTNAERRTLNAEGSEVSREARVEGLKFKV
jgi:hypothetical protein